MKTEENLTVHYEKLVLNDKIKGDKGLHFG